MFSFPQNPPNREPAAMSEAGTADAPAAGAADGADGAAGDGPRAQNPLPVHATSVAIDGCAVLLRGPAGCGKSDLALCLIDGGARLVADDVSLVWGEGPVAMVGAPPALHGRLTLCDIGVVSVPAETSAPLALVVDLLPGHAAGRRTPAGDWGEPTTARIAGIAVPSFEADPLHPATPAKIRALLRRLRPPAATATGGP